MLFSKIVAATLLAYVSADPAPVTRDSPRGVVYEANFRGRAGVSGFVRFYSVNGQPRYVINVRGLPSSGGPFMYHVHQRKVPQSGNCADTLGDFNPYDGVPNAQTEAEHEVGDLSGKHGSITGRSYRKIISDDYVSLNPQNDAFIGDLSVVIHRSDGSRIVCANLEKEGGNQKRYMGKFDLAKRHDEDNDWEIDLDSDDSDNEYEVDFDDDGYSHEHGKGAPAKFVT